MTIYLNPTKMTKDEFLKQYGKELPRGVLHTQDLDDHSESCVVCLVENTSFKAAGILDCQRDLEDFLDPRDYRPRKFYLVPTSAINAEGGAGRIVS